MAATCQRWPQPFLVLAVQLHDVCDPEIAHAFTRHQAAVTVGRSMALIRRTPMRRRDGGDGALDWH
jgi:hypothetical protein